MICAGIDAGSRSIKIVIRDNANGRVLGRGAADQGLHQEERTAALLAQVCRTAGIAPRDIANMVATGYGRNLIRNAGRKITEITCQAAGSALGADGIRGILDIGGQDSKFILLGDNGKVADFAMNDRCAAGTGRFLEMAATRLGVELEEFGRMAEASNAPAAISSMCAVFAETEIVALLAEGMEPADIAAGITRSVAARVASLAGRLAAGPVLFTGGVALVKGVREALESAFGQPVFLAQNPQFTGALGAAILAGQ